MSYAKWLSLVLAVLLVTAPSSMAVAAPPDRGAAPIFIPPSDESVGTEYEEESVPNISTPTREQLKLIMTRDVMPMTTQYTMALFIWQADPVAACEAGKAVEAGSIRLQDSIARLREIVAENGDDLPDFDTQIRGMLSKSAEGGKIKARFCDHIVAQKLNAADKAAFKKGEAMLNVALTELHTAIDAKLADDDANSCVSMHVVAATASDFENFIASEAQASEVMSIMKRSRVMEMIAEIREMAENGLPDCAVE